MKLQSKFLALMLCFILAFSLPLAALANDDGDDRDVTQSNYSEEIEELQSEISDLEEEINDIEEEMDELEEQLEELETDYEAAEEEYEEAVEDNDTELAAEKQSLMEEIEEDIEELEEEIEEYEEDIEELEEQIKEFEEQIEELEEENDEEENDDDENGDEEIKPWEQLKNDLEGQKDEAEAEKDYAENQFEHYKKLYESTGEEQYLEEMEYWFEQRDYWFGEMRKFKTSMREVIKGKYTEEEWENLQELSETLQAKGLRTLPVNNIFVRNANVKFDTPPVIKDGRLLIPLRALSTATGANVKWNEDNKIITIEKGDIVIELEIDDNKIYIDGVESEIDVPAQLVNSRTVVPVRFIVQNLNLNVDWDSQDNTVEIY